MECYVAKDKHERKAYVENDKIPSNFKGCHIETFAILSYANGSITKTRRDDAISYLSRDYKQLRSGVPKSSEYLFGDYLNQSVQAITKTCKNIKTNL